MMRRWRADLHVHTCLSPCGEAEMVPWAIVNRALEAKLDIIAVCDHNASANVEAVMVAGDALGLAVLPGIEIATREEAHILGLFDSLSDLQSVQEHVDEYLAGDNDPELFGHQWIVDEAGEVLGEDPRLLIGACDLALDEVVGLIRAQRGCAIASHVDRAIFSVISQLGFIPDVPLNGLEVSPLTTVAAARERLGLDPGYEVIRSSDAHRLEEIGRVATVFELAAPTVAEIRRALEGADGRRIVGT